MDICGVLIGIRDEVLFGYEDVIFPWRTASGWAFQEWLVPKSPS